MIELKQPLWLSHLYQLFQPFQPFQSFGIQRTPYAASQFNYGGGAAAGGGFQPRGRGGRCIGPSIQLQYHQESNE
ncbi:MAG: hypothetical protein EZS28_031821 [Streblomastix strix]|uniref:Uncharacterized protein n=1 Tax=Streblomastix strix TaxID=222440 RepID=A0A5J4URH4_9EUKA|nr:MAG: hypothetical protein EZS28_031821 [Streblomastix strix]